MIEKSDPNRFASLTWLLRLRLLAFLLLIACCAGCATLSPTPRGCVKIGPVGHACPLPPAALPAVQANHIVTVEHAAEKNTFLGRLAVDQHALRLAGASLFGTHLFTITWDGQSIVSQPSEPKMHPDLVVVMLEMALADPAQIRPRLHGMVLKVKQDGDKNIRELYEHGHLVARIERSGTPLAAAHLVIHIPPADLTLRLNPMHASSSPAAAGSADGHRKPGVH